MNITVSASTGLKAGDKFTIAGVDRLNPEVREDTGELMTFTVIEAPDDPGSELPDGTLVISPAIISEGPYRNCSAAGQSGAALTFLDHKTNNPSIFWCQDAIKLIPGNLPVYGGGVEKVDATTAQGLPFRTTYWYDPNLEEMFFKTLIFFDCEVWLPSQVGIILDEQTTQ